MTRKKVSTGFTLAELLIALAILGVIATFTIPKVINTQQNSAYNSSAKEAAGMISGAFQAYKLSGNLSTNTSASDLSQYFNYVSYDTTGSIDGEPGYTTWTCAANAPCLHLHGGGILKLRAYTFNGSTTTNVISFFFDPDGIVNGTTNGTGKSVMFLLNYSGQLETKNMVLTGSTDSSGTTYSTSQTEVPSWFSW